MRGWAALLLACFACHRSSVPAIDLASSEAGQGGGPGVADAAAAVASPRCRVVGRPSVLAEDSGEVEMGDAADWGDAVAVGFTRSGGGHRIASVALIGAGIDAPVSHVDLDPAPPLGPPPMPFVVGRSLRAVAWVVPEADASTGSALALYAIEGKEAHRLALYAHRSKELPALAGAGGGGGSLVAWDDENEGRGVIRVATQPEGRGPAVADLPHTVSPAGTDADGPRLLARPGGYWLLWVAHKPQADENAVDAAELEVVAEGREFRWVELAALDASGVLAGSIRRITSTTGHISAFGVAPLGDGLLVVVRDDDAGGRILGVSVQGDTPNTPMVLVGGGASGGGAGGGGARGGGAGRGAPAVLAVGPSLAWLAYQDDSDRTRLLALGKGGESIGPPSNEPLLDDARLLGSAHGLLIAANQAVRTLSCPPP
jgi:hypothetical protein